MAFNLEQLGGTIHDGVCVYSADRNIAIKKGDFIISVGSEPVHNRSDIHRIVSKHSPGAKVQIEFIRGEELKVGEVLIGAQGFRLDKVISTLKNQATLRKQTAVNKGVDDQCGSILVRIRWDEIGNTLLFDIKNASDIEGVQNKKVYVEATLGDDNKKYKPVKTTVQKKTDMPTWDAQLSFQAQARWEQFCKLPLKLTVKEKKTFGSDKVIGHSIWDLTSLVKGEVDPVPQSYPLYNNETYKNVVESTASLGVTKAAEDIAIAPAKLDIKFFNIDGVCVQKVKVGGHFGMANVNAGEVIVGVLDKNDPVVHKIASSAKFEGTGLGSVAMMEQELKKRHRECENLNDVVEVSLVTFQPKTEVSPIPDVTTTHLIINDYVLASAAKTAKIKQGVPTEKAAEPAKEPEKEPEAAFDAAPTLPATAAPTLPETAAPELPSAAPTSSAPSTPASAPAVPESAPGADAAPALPGTPALPSSDAPSLPSSGPAPELPASGPALPANWAEMLDKDGKTYFFNSETGDTTWERPRGSVDG